MKRLVIALVLIASILTSCAAKPAPEAGSSSEAVRLTPYHTATSTPTITATAPDVPTATLAPTVTPTPGTYVVKANDTLIVIAYRNGLTLDELKAANPDVNAYNLAIGMKLSIPAAKPKPGTQTAPTPTPATALIHSARCVPSLSGGAYCYAIVENPLDVDLENLSAEFRLTDPATGEVATQSAQLLLSKLRAGSALPLYTYFSPQAAKNVQVSVLLLTATTAETSGSKIAALAISDQQMTLAPDGLSAVITGSASLEGEGWSVKNIHLAAAAYDAANNIIGVRRVEIAEDLQSGGTYPFKLMIYSTGGKILRVDVYGEGLP